MHKSPEKVVSQLHTPYITESLRSIARGIEKESLRILPNGHLAQSPHPKALGSALTHPYITTDYSEALLEFITPAYSDPQAPLQFLTDIHRFIYENLDEEKLWVNSMPCIMGNEDSIPIAQYGSSNSGQMKTIYRHGLWHRYGRLMQTIAGIHYNFSFPNSFWKLYQEQQKDSGPLQDFIDTGYFNLIRNFQRYNWLPIYLFGASPAVCASFLRDRKHNLESTATHTLFKPYATSLRMSDLGYQNNAQSGLIICYNKLDSYVETLNRAIRTPHSDYEQIGVKVDGQYKQLNSNILQIENEYYGSIRPKRTTERGERPTLALKRRGVEYIEMRCVDLNPFQPIGIDQTQMNFLDLFALYCLLIDSPQLNPQEQQRIKHNLNTVVLEGRHTGSPLTIGEQTQTIKQWGIQLCEEMEAIAAMLDDTYQTDQYTHSLQIQKDKFIEPDATPSAQILNQIAKEQSSFYHFAMDRALEHEQYFKSQPLDEVTRKQFQQWSQESLEQQEHLEAADFISFEKYLENYFAN